VVRITGGGAGELTYTLLDPRGALVAQGRTTSRTIPVAHLRPGTYAVLLNNVSGQRTAQKLTILR